MNHGRSLVIAGVLGAASPAAAQCPTQPDDAVCRPWTAMLMPTAFGVTYSPREGSTYVGGGFEAVAIAWSDNSDAFGPSQGRVRFDFAVLGALGSDEPDLGTMMMYRGGAQVAFERNASRGFGIPYFTFDLGGLWTEVSRTRWFADGGLGIYVVHRRNVIIDLEATAVLPFKDPDTYAGVRVRIGVSFSLW